MAVGFNVREIGVAAGMLVSFYGRLFIFLHTKPFQSIPWCSKPLQVCERFQIYWHYCVYLHCQTGAGGMPSILVTPLLQEGMPRLPDLGPVLPFFSQ